MLDDIVTITTFGGTRHMSAAEVVRVRARHSDAVLNGAFIGAGAAIAAGLFLCTRTEPWENCRDDVGPIARIGAIGAGIGIAIDALVRGRRTIYEAPPPGVRVRVTPVATHRIRGLQVTVGF